jgi:hypothetical protein
MVSEVLWLLPGTSLDDQRQIDVDGGVRPERTVPSGADPFPLREKTVLVSTNAAKHKSAVDIPMVAV